MKDSQNFIPSAARLLPLDPAKLLHNIPRSRSASSAGGAVQGGRGPASGRRDDKPARVYLMADKHFNLSEGRGEKNAETQKLTWRRRASSAIALAPAPGGTNT